MGHNNMEYYEMAAPCYDTGSSPIHCNGTPVYDLNASLYDNMSSPHATLAGSAEGDPPGLVKQPLHMLVLYTIAYSTVFALGITGNSLVVSVVYRDARMHSVTNYFIVNLAVADILVCLCCLPITLLGNLLYGWMYGSVMCKVTPFLQGVSVSASVNTLAAIAIDRYLAICHVLEFRLTRRRARLTILCIWTFAALIYTPWIVFYERREYEPGVYTCDQYWPSPASQRAFFLGVICLTCYTIPLALITVCYTLIGCRVWNRNATGVANTNRIIYRSKVKALKMLLVVVAFFALSWLPLYIVNIRFHFGPPLNPETSEFTILYQIIVPIAQWLGSSNSCVNPIIYCFFSKKFRNGFQQTIACWYKKQSGHKMVRNNSAVYFSVNDGTTTVAEHLNKTVLTPLSGKQKLISEVSAV